MKKRLNRNVIDVGDVVCTSSKGVFQYLIKLITYGWKKRHSLNAVNHVGIVFRDRDGVLKVAEMLTKEGLTISVFQKFHRLKKLKVVGVASHSNLNVKTRKRINEAVLGMIYDDVPDDYDLRGVLGFIAGGIEDSECDWFCSELCSYFWSMFANVPLSENPSKVPPSYFDPNQDKKINGVYFLSRGLK